MKKIKKINWKNIKKSRVAAGAVLLALLIWLSVLAGDMFGWSGNGEKVMVSIPDGCTVKGIADILEQEDVIEYTTAFRIYEKLGGEHIFKMGGHRMDKGMSYGEIIVKLTGKPEVEFNNNVNVVIPEGYEARQIADKLAEEGLVDRDRFMDELENGEFDYWFVKEIERKENRLEGYLFPATYEISMDDTEHDIICRMLDSFEAQVVPVYKSAGTDMTLDQVVTFASVVEREAANDGERPIVASVFYNRMEKDMTLSSCATVQYILKERKDVLSNADVAIKSDYNTYINKGLPVGPIASPGVSSVKAVMFPADTNYLFFAARADGSENVFAETDEEHLRNVEELQGK